MPARLRAFISAGVLLCLLTAASAQQAPGTAWPTYGGDPGGQRFTSAAEITGANVSRLVPAWTFHTGAIQPGRTGSDRASFEATPILFEGLLYLSTPYDVVFALDPTTGVARWQFDPKLQRNLSAGILTSRGVASWRSSTLPSRAPCAARIFIATFDSRLIAVDARSGQPCAGFGTHSEIDLRQNVRFREDAAYFNSSPPTVVGDVVVVGSGIVDNTRVDLESGIVRAYSCDTGRLLWTWDPIPWASQQTLRTGAANAWSVIAADPEHNLIFVPTGSASPDFYGGTRPGDDRDANSVVALDATTGRRVWGFQVVHHDLWDYDVAAEPLLFTFRGSVPAIAITTKQGLIFVLNRLTGDPLYPVTERPVPSSDIPGEQASPTQPFQEALATLSPTSLPPDAMLGATPQDNTECRAIMRRLRYKGMYTPPSFRGSLAFPGNLGGVNWGSAAIDPATGVLYANTNRYAFSLTLAPRVLNARTKLMMWTWPKRVLMMGVLLVALLILIFGMRRRRSLFPGFVSLSFALAVLVVVAIVNHFQDAIGPYSPGPYAPPPGREAEHFGREFGRQLGTPYTILRQQIVAPTSHHPCTVLPWGAVSAVNLNTGKPAWQTPLGTVIAGQRTGTINLGGDIVTGSGLLFTAASEQPLLRALDARTGSELWQGTLPVPAQATPMSYVVHGRQYVVIAAGGHGLFGTPVSDAVVAFALPGNASSVSSSQAHADQSHPSHLHMVAMTAGRRSR